ncbi:hypothetical protein [Candidatus Laterigemmans baculatus]|uniref:hypothetical protein n=1 Tax=Candidatus Laterigemmans baculatus TaxID=2770505 RepID=UPI0013DC049A|nr:hypothetical protein [Candidatus Laterigemmans baculatus]
MTRITVPTPTHGYAPSHSPPDVHYAPGLGLARGLGWFSIGLGLAELLAPRTVARWSGVSHPGLIQAYGVREILTGVGILSSSRPAGWVAARVAGDALDLATIGEAAYEDDEQRRRAGLAAATVAGVMAVDLLCYSELRAGEALEG